MANDEKLKAIGDRLALLEAVNDLNMRASRLCCLGAWHHKGSR